MPSLLVRLPNHLGDACMATPALDLLEANGSRLTLVGRSWARELYAAYGWAVETLPARRWARVALLRHLHAQGAASSGLLLTNSFSSALEFRLAGLRGAGYARDGRRWLLAQAVPVPAQWAGDMHTAAYYHHLACRWLGIEAALGGELSLRLDAGARKRASGLLGAAGVAPPYVMLCPVAIGRHRGRVKAWDGFARLCRELAAAGHTVLACPGPGERDALAQAVPDARLLDGTDVGAFAALLAASALVVANDSGAGHLAAAVGARLVSIFGVTDPAKTRPWGRAVRVLGGQHGWPPYEAVAAAAFASLADAAAVPGPLVPLVPLVQ